MSGHHNTNTIFSVVVTGLSIIPNSLMWSQAVNVSLLCVGSCVTLISCEADGSEAEAVFWFDEILKHINVIKREHISDIRRNCWNYLKIWTVWFYKRAMCSKEANGNAWQSVKTLIRLFLYSWSSLISVYTFCSDLSVWKLRITTVIQNHFHLAISQKQRLHKWETLKANTCMCRCDY